MISDQNHKHTNIRNKGKDDHRGVAFINHKRQKILHMVKGHHRSHCSNITYIALLLILLLSVVLRRRRRPNRRRSNWIMIMGWVAVEVSVLQSSRFFPLHYSSSREANNSTREGVTTILLHWSYYTVSNKGNVGIVALYAVLEHAILLLLFRAGSPPAMQ